MKVYIANYEPERIGGGWSFARNFAQGMADKVTFNYDESDIYFIPSASMVKREQVDQAKNDGKKIVLRVDNALRNSRNRGSGMTRLYEFSHKADLVIYQSSWAKEYISEFTKKEGVVILNGVDLDVFQDIDKHNPNNYLYSRFNRDETKNWEVARYYFSREHAKNNSSTLHIVGNFSEDIRQYNFDFYNNENYVFLGVLTEKSMAKLYSTCGKFIYTYFNDACSNSLIEALVSGCEVVGDRYYLKTGGAKEIVDNFTNYGRDYFSIDRMIKEYEECLVAIA